MAKGVDDPDGAVDLTVIEVFAEKMAAAGGVGRAGRLTLALEARIDQGLQTEQAAMARRAARLRSR
jgi:hypothetical protein